MTQLSHSRVTPESGKHAFVTVGTTRFDEFVSALTSPTALQMFVSQGYSSLTIQYGTGEKPVLENSGLNLHIQCYSFQPSLSDDMQRADLILSHAGAGTVMEALKLRKKLVVVINTLLMNNHQEELACAMAQRGHLFMVANPELLEKRETWTLFEDFCPVVHQGGDDRDFPRLLDSFLGFAVTKED
jgi:beta-1,4-N-acetylglucosaminyltransferase